LKNIERLRDRVTELHGEVKLKIFPPTGRDYYILSYDPGSNEAEYRKITACAGDARETVEVAWLSTVFDVLNSKGVAVRVEWADRQPQWFDTDFDETAIARAYASIVP